MNALSNTFPSATNLLCQWHIEKNILAKGKKELETQEAFESFQMAWRTVVGSTTESEYDKQKESLEKEYPTLFTYVDETWLPFKEKFVRAWTDKVLHLGHLVTSRIEGKHAVLKSWIGTSSGDLRDVYQKVILAIEDQQRTVNQQLAVEKTRTILSLNSDLWAKVHRKISLHALRKAGDQFKMRHHTSEDKPCSGVFSATLGIPCVHKIQSLIATEKALDKSDFHWMWWLDGWESAVQIPREEHRDFEHGLGGRDQEQGFGDLLSMLGSQHESLAPHQQRFIRDEVLALSQTSLNVYDPKPVSTRGRSKGSTKRLPSAFEHVEKELAQKVKKTKRTSKSKRAVRI